jgi:predicted esterase
MRGASVRQDRLRPPRKERRLTLPARASLFLLFRALREAVGWPRTGRRLTTYRIAPSAVDPAVTKYDDANFVLFDRRASAAAPLVVFLPGTDGKPRQTRPLLRLIARQGYRAIGLKYNDTPAVDPVCQNDPDLDCAEAFRRMRVYGDGSSRHVANPPAESIVARLTSLLKALDRRRPGENWGAYLQDGAPNWSRIVVSGLSQGAGMAAYIAKKNHVARVVLFSGPWDVAGPDRSPAPWLSTSSATPPHLWFAGYSKREKTSRAIARAYAALAIPADHVEVFDLDLPKGVDGAKGVNPYHGITIRDRRYAPQWRALFGRPQG